MGGDGWHGRSLWRRALRHLAPFVLPRWKLGLVAALALVAGSAFELLKPWPLKFVFDFLLKDLAGLQETRRLWLLAAICISIVAVAALSSLAAYFREYLLSRAGEEVAFDLRVALFRHIQGLHLGFHDSRKIGDIITRVSSDVSAVREMATRYMIELATAVITLAGMLLIMFIMDWRLSLVGLVIAPILCPVVWYFRRRIERASRSRKLREVEVTSLAQETMSSIRLVKAFGREAYQQKRFRGESSKSAQVGLQVAKLEAGYVWAVDIVTALGTCAVVWWGVGRIMAGSLTPGDLYVFVMYVKGLYSPIRDLAKQSTRIAKGKVGLERVVEVLDTQPAVRERPDAVEAPPFRGAVELRGVSFQYLPDRTVLHDVSVRAEPGQVVALVGYSGAGKSTVLSLIPRLYDPTAGTVLIDGRDIREFRLQSLRNQIGIVLQESVLLQTTILENILYGRPDATPEEVDAAARAALVDQFIDRLPDGYRTVVGPGGATLSGGERQRVAIARAMIRDAPILLLDEPTTGLDVESERLVMEALRALMRGRTTIVISHKLGLIERADSILVVENGRITESGTHAELLAAGGRYAHLHAVGAAADGDGQGVPGTESPRPAVPGVRR